MATAAGVVAVTAAARAGQRAHHPRGRRGHHGRDDAWREHKDPQLSPTGSQIAGAPQPRRHAGAVGQALIQRCQQVLIQRHRRQTLADTRGVANEAEDEPLTVCEEAVRRMSFLSPQRAYEDMERGGDGERDTELADRGGAEPAQEMNES